MRVLYILMRTDLPSMNAGKAMAQASHASNAFIKLHGKKCEVKDWEKQTKHGFGTVIVLGAIIEDIDALQTKLEYINEIYDVVVDPTYPYIVNSEIRNLIDPLMISQESIQLESGDYICFRPETTCAYLFGEKDIIEKYVEHLKLHP